MPLHAWLLPIRQHRCKSPQTARQEPLQEEDCAVATSAAKFETLALGAPALALALLSGLLLSRP
jgi:hypothetical protein